VSGGLDSMVLLNMMNKLNYKISVAHVNHGLRENESDTDEYFIKKICERHKLPFYSNNIKESLDASTGNLQENARNLRYTYFNKLRKELGAQWILTAHHQDDAIETMIHNFFRGTGLDGLIGIKLKSDCILRPMLYLKKEDLLNYAKKHSISYREDSSNQSDKYKRNFIRHNLLDSQTTLFDNQRQRLNTTLNNLQRTAELSKYLISKLKKEIMIKTYDQYHVDLKKLNELDYKASIVFELFKPFGFNLNQCKDLVFDLKQTGRKIESHTHLATIERDHIKLISTHKSEPPDLHIEVFKGDKQIKLEGNRTLLLNYFSSELNMASIKHVTLDVDRLQFPLILRYWKKGDLFYPAGMGGKSQKVSKALRNYKVDHSEKAKQLVLVSAGQICALIPYRASENHKVDSECKNIVEIQLEKY